jgi:hypothetical protein
MGQQVSAKSSEPLIRGYGEYTADADTAENYAMEKMDEGDVDKAKVWALLAISSRLAALEWVVGIKRGG